MNTSLMYSSLRNCQISGEGLEGNGPDEGEEEGEGNGNGNAAPSTDWRRKKFSVEIRPPDGKATRLSMERDKSDSEEEGEGFGVLPWSNRVQRKIENWAG